MFFLENIYPLLCCLIETQDIIWANKISNSPPWCKHYNFYNFLNMAPKVREWRPQISKIVFKFLHEFECYGEVCKQWLWVYLYSPLACYKILHVLTKVLWTYFGGQNSMSKYEEGGTWFYRKLYTLVLLLNPIHGDVLERSRMAGGAVTARTVKTS